MTIWLVPPLTVIAVLLTLDLLARLKSHTSTRPSPIRSTTETPPSDAIALQMMDAMNKAWAEQMKETRAMVSDLTLGRPQPTTSTPETWPMQNERLLDFDYDSTPLSPGIEAVLEREEVETEQERILREREELQRQLVEKQAEMDRFDLETSSEPGPWTNGDNPRHAKTD